MGTLPGEVEVVVSCACLNKRLVILSWVVVVWKMLKFVEKIFRAMYELELRY